jgi:ArsR family transcriptional regulator, zinc-responsive transcriptional repressor
MGMRAAKTIRPTDLDKLRDAAECLRTLAHPVRLRMVQLMLRGELTVGQLAAACEIPSHMASEHLRMMQHCGLLARRPDGRRIYYQVVEPTVARLMECIESRFGGE